MLAAGFFDRLYVMSLLTILPKHFFASELEISRFLSGERGECKERGELSVARFACRFLEPRYIHYSPFYPHRGAWFQAICSRNRGHVVCLKLTTGMSLLDFSGRLYSVCLYDLDTGIWGHPSDLFLTTSDPLSVNI